MRAGCLSWGIPTARSVEIVLEIHGKYLQAGQTSFRTLWIKGFGKTAWKLILRVPNFEGLDNGQATLARLSCYVPTQICKVVFVFAQVVPASYNIPHTTACPCLSQLFAH